MSLIRPLLAPSSSRTATRGFSQLTRKKLGKDDVPGRTASDVMKGLGVALVGASVLRLSARTGFTNVLPLLATGGVLMGSSVIYSRYRRWRFEEEYGPLEGDEEFLRRSRAAAATALGLAAVSLPATVAYDDYSTKQVQEVVNEALARVNEDASTRDEPRLRLTPARPVVRKTDWNKAEIEFTASYEAFGTTNTVPYVVTATKETSFPSLGRWKMEGVRRREASE